jgi:hypothetical protein
MSEYFTESQKEDLRYFQENLPDFLENPLYKHKFAIVFDKKIVGIFDTFSNAIEEAAATLPEGMFIIQQIIREDEIISFLHPALA